MSKFINYCYKILHTCKSLSMKRPYILDTRIVPLSVSPTDPHVEFVCPIPVNLNFMSLEVLVFRQKILPLCDPARFPWNF
jgi:hypothetical protein